jgi:hypothetical protein
MGHFKRNDFRGEINMCIEKHAIFQEIKEGRDYGWKIWIKTKEKYSPPVCRLYLSFPAETWIKDPNKERKIKLFPYKEYPSGFHFFLYKKDAEKYWTTLENHYQDCLDVEIASSLVLTKIYFRGIVESGYIRDNTKVLVSQNIFICV